MAVPVKWHRPFLFLTIDGALILVDLICVLAIGAKGIVKRLFYLFFHVHLSLLFLYSIARRKEKIKSKAQKAVW